MLCDRSEVIVQCEVIRSLCKQPIIIATPETLIINLIAGDSPRMQKNNYAFCNRCNNNNNKINAQKRIIKRKKVKEHEQVKARS